MEKSEVSMKTAMINKAYVMNILLKRRFSLIFQNAGRRIMG